MSHRAGNTREFDKRWRKACARAKLAKQQRKKNRK